MTKLWYGSDEVNDFHPVVEKCLNDALKLDNLDKKYIIKHHFGSFTTGIPDFVLLDRVTEDFVCVIEVKKTPSDVFYFGTGYQAKEYIDELYPLRWKTNYFPHFCTTNIEITQFYCWRKKATLIGCMLSGSPKDSGRLEEGEKCFERFTKLFSEYFKSIDSLANPEYSMHLEAISESFNESFTEISKILGVNLVRMNRLIHNEEQIKESIIYELLRFAFYYYIKELYWLINSPFAKNFPEFKVENLTQLELISLIEENFSKAMEIDFKDILKDHKSSNAIIPNKLKQDKELSEVFNSFIQILRDNAKQGIQKNTNLLNFVSLLTSEIFNKEEMHTQGKIMSDEALSNILAEFAISSADDKIIDPCCGDGNLLISAYNKVKKISKKSHNEILSQLSGIEIDANLIQLAAFKLICSNLKSVNKNTLTSLLNSDLFDDEHSKGYDALVMNPPFLRNEDVKPEIKAKYLKNLEKISGKESFIREVSQPNIYFYFVEKATCLLNENGAAAIILMTKFLNNEDGAYLKKFLVPHIEAIISYPPDFFEGFKVTTCIVILKKNTTNPVISFLRVRDNSILSDVNNIKTLISKNKNDEITEKYTLIRKKRAEINPKDNWRLFLIDPENKFSQFNSLEFFCKLKTYFDTIQRGKADNCGGSSLIYPNSSNNPLMDKVENIEKKYVGCGLQRNKLSKSRRKVILTLKCLESQAGLIFPNIFASGKFDVALKQIKNDDGFYDYLKAAEELKIKDKKLDMQKIVVSCLGSVVTPKIVIPRADREKHIVYYNPINKPVLVSTNFFYASNPINFRKDLDVEIQIKFIVGFLNSSFGQIQFEIHSNNQEGMRKIEGFMIEKIKVPKLDSLTKEEIVTVAYELDKLDIQNIDYLGIEKINPRRNLDLAVGKIIFSRTKLSIKSVEDFVDYFEQFNAEIVHDRSGNDE